MTTFSLCLALVTGIVAAAWLIDRQQARYEAMVNRSVPDYATVPSGIPSAVSPLADPRADEIANAVEHADIDLNWILKRSGNGTVPAAIPGAASEESGESMN